VTVSIKNTAVCNGDVICFLGGDKFFFIVLLIRALFYKWSGKMFQYFCINPLKPSDYYIYHPL
jgi:hypothetical protein